MSLSIYQASVPVFVRTLTNLKNILAKGAAHAQAKKIDEEGFMQARLAPDMFPFTSQVHIATDMARAGAARLTGNDPPKYEDTEKTIDELKARVAKTVAYLKSLDKAKIDAAADREITFPLGPVNKGAMKGDDYLTHFVLPNFYFHLTATYAILRHAGVEVGKRDFLGQIPLKMT